MMNVEITGTAVGVIIAKGPPGHLLFKFALIQDAGPGATWFSVLFPAEVIDRVVIRDDDRLTVTGWEFGELPAGSTIIADKVENLNRHTSWDAAPAVCEGSD